MHKILKVFLLISHILSTRHRTLFKMTDLEEMTSLVNSENVDGEVAPPKSKFLYDCPKCSRSFNHLGHMKCHFYRVHSEFKLSDHFQSEPEPNKTCFNCHSSFDTVKEMKQHECPEATSKKSYDCTHCDMKFTQKTSLHLHCLRNHRNNDYVCGVCKKGCASTAGLAAHMRVHESKKAESSSDSEEPPPMSIDSEENSTEVPMEETEDEPPKFNCEKCDQSFKTGSSLKAHLTTHEESKFSCDKCSESFTNKTSLNQHAKTHQTKTFKCDTCDEAFTTKVGLGRHRLIHKNEKEEIVCKECEKYFSTKQLLKTHMKQHAKAAGKKFSCAKCGRNFALKCHLARHIPVHDNE